MRPLAKGFGMWVKKEKLQTQGPALSTLHGPPEGASLMDRFAMIPMKLNSDWASSIKSPSDARSLAATTSMFRSTLAARA